MTHRREWFTTFEAFSTSLNMKIGDAVGRGTIKNFLYVPAVR